jgi:hypothetical protein
VAKKAVADTWCYDCEAVICWCYSSCLYLSACDVVDEARFACISEERANSMSSKCKSVAEQAIHVHVPDEWLPRASTIGSFVPLKPPLDDLSSGPLSLSLTF